MKISSHSEQFQKIFVSGSKPIKTKKKSKFNKKLQSKNHQGPKTYLLGYHHT